MLEGDAPGEITERDPPASALRLYTIPAHRAFADALVAGLRRQVGDDPLALARGLILLPNNRSKRAIQDAFVRASGGGLLLPRLVTIGDPALDEASGVLFDPADDPEPLPPAVAPMVRRLTLARLVAEERPGIGADEAVRLAGELARTLDQLLVEEVSPGRLRELELSPELSEHWRRALSLFRIVLDRWPAELARLGAIDAADRRTRMLSRLARRWRDAPPPGFVCAAGVTDPAPSVARLLRTVARMPRGSVVFPDLAIDMPEEEWDALGPHPRDPVTGIARRSIETHPQFQLKLLLTRMGAQRGEVALWRGGTDLDATLARGRAIANALSPAAFTGKWTDFPADRRRLAGIAAVEVATMAEEAQAVALALREALETPGRTAALVTPDRNLARRVAAHCRRWGIEVDDSAGRPLALTPPGTFFVALAEAAAQDVAPLPLLALLKHPLVRAGEARPAWLASVRALDRALRGPRPSPGLAGIAAHLADAPERERPIRAAAAKDWPAFAALLTPLAEQFARGPQPLADWIAGLREAGQLLCGDALWAGPAGRAAAELIASLEAAGGQGPALVEAAALAPLLRVLMAEVAVRPPQGGHPRLAIYGLIEARLQRADLMILGGLNEGTWPGAPAPDPWLAPRVRAELGLPGLERGVGIAAHDLASALGAPRALITRARRGGQGPALASRFWLRLEALAGERFERATTLEAWARALDDPGVHAPAERPAPSPRVDQRPTAISVTEVDRLKADPFAFYARRVLRLSALDPVDAEPSPAWRGDAVHAILRAWAEEDDGAPGRLVARARAARP